MADISLTLRAKTYFDFGLYLILLPKGQLLINQHWSRQWFGAEQTTSHYRNQWWPSLLTQRYVNSLNTLRPRQSSRHFPDDIFKCIFLNENAWISIKISLKFVPNGPINKIPALVQIMAWRRSGDKPLSEPMMVSLLTHICVTRPQWVNVFGQDPDICRCLQADVLE